MIAQALEENIHGHTTKTNYKKQLYNEQLHSDSNDNTQTQHPDKERTKNAKCFWFSMDNMF